MCHMVSWLLTISQTRLLRQQIRKSDLKEQISALIFSRLQERLNSDANLINALYHYTLNPPTSQLDQLLFMDR